MMRIPGMTYGISAMVQRSVPNRTNFGYGSSYTHSTYGSKIGSTYGTTQTKSASRVGSIYGTTGSTGRYGSTYRISSYGNTGSVYGSARSAAAARMEQMYEDTMIAAQNVRTHANVLMNSGERTGKEAITDARNFVNDYNVMVEQMKNAGGSNNLMYRSQLNSSFASHREELAAVGITAGKDGMLVLDEKALANADTSAVSKAFGGAGSFVGEASVKSIYVEADTVSNRLSARYGSYGSYGYYGGYGSYGSSNPYTSLSNSYSSFGYSPYGSLNTYNMLGRLFNSYF